MLKKAVVAYIKYHCRPFLAELSNTTNELEIGIQNWIHHEC
jgi:hypothetical protein